MTYLDRGSQLTYEACGRQACTNECKSATQGMGLNIQVRYPVLSGMFACSGMHVSQCLMSHVCLHAGPMLAVPCLQSRACPASKLFSADVACSDSIGHVMQAVENERRPL